VAHDSFPPLTQVNIPEYDVDDFCIQVENLKLDPTKNNEWLQAKQAEGSTILAIIPHFTPKFDSWEILVVFSEAWNDEQSD
jgi:hypothetical protein